MKHSKTRTYSGLKIIKKSLWFSREQLPSPRGTGSGLLSPPRLSPGGVLRAGLCSAPWDRVAAVLLAQRPGPMAEVGLVSRYLWETSAGLSRGKVKGERGHCFRKGEDTGDPASTRLALWPGRSCRGADGEQESVHLAVHGWIFGLSARPGAIRTVQPRRQGRTSPFPQASKGTQVWAAQRTPAPCCNLPYTCTA